jgi:CRP/FNR family transcriptional regulator
MSESLKKHIEKLTHRSEPDFDSILSFFSTLHIRKKQNLQEQGEPGRYNYFVVTGCLRMFFINDKGTEKTIQFAIENWWLADYLAFHNQKISGFYIQAVEPSEILAIDYNSQEKMLKQFPQMERYFRMVHQKAHGALQMRTKLDYDLSKEEFFLNFIGSYPQFVQRIPQYLLASYLNITPEYLSELRAKSIS